MMKVHSWRFIVHSILFFLALFVILCTPYPGFSQSISSVELINNLKQYDGKLVVYEGEVIGDVMLRGEYAWVNINDGKNAIGIWIKKELLKDIINTGSYNVKGDLVEIAGKFNRSCVEHGGDVDIHAQSINKISSGGRISCAVNTKAINLALGLSCVILLFYLLRARYLKKAG